MTRSDRAEPLAADVRRRAIVDAVVPLLVDRGASVTTREMAEAAGIAEGTIFRVFPDKCALIHEAVRVTVDPAPYLEQLARIDHEAPLEDQLLEATRTLLERSQAVVALLAVLHTLPPPSAKDTAGWPPRFVTEAHRAVSGALTALLERHRDRLAIEPARAAAAMRGLVLASVHPAVARSERLTAEEIVRLLVGGISKAKGESG